MAEGQCVPTPDLPCRANLDLMPPGTGPWMYALTGLAAVVFAYGVWQMWSVWRMGRKWKAGDWREGLKRLVKAVMTHGKFRQDPRPGTMHMWIFLGFLVLFIGTTIVAIDADVFELLFDSKLLQGQVYLWFELVLDVFGVLFLVGVSWAFIRRYVEKPPQLHRSDFPERPPAWRRIGGDGYALIFLFLIGVTGFLMEALRLRHQIIDDQITYASYSFVGYSLSALFETWSLARIEAVYFGTWWLHFVLWTSVLAVLPWTKFKHIVTSSLNIFFHDPLRQSRPEIQKPFDLREMMESGATDVPDVGVTTVRDLTWKDRLSLDACTNCGRCEAQCPAWAAGRPLSPRKLIQDMKTEMWEDWRSGRRDPDHEPRPLTQADGVGPAVMESTLWSCVTCRACVTACPVDIEHVDMIVGMRQSLVDASKLDENQTKLLVNVTNAGNPYGFAASDRGDWRNALPPGIQVPLAAEKAAAGETFEYLWWVGCSGSFDPRNQQVTRAIATVLNAADVDFAILGAEERCNGDPVRRLGEEGRFQQSAMENQTVLEQYGVRRVITQCPHCFNTLQNEYGQMGIELDVVHHTQLIERLLEEDRVPLRDGAPLKVTYHDSCYLGRHNGIYDSPRRALQKATGLPVLEMAQSRDEGMCCGAGGANMWFEIKDEKERINVIRARQAADTGADTVATACPFCLTMLSDGIGLTGNDERMAAKDLAEIVAEHLDWEQPEGAGGAPPEQAAVGGEEMEWAG